MSLRTDALSVTLTSPVRRDAATAAFFDGCARGEFLMRQHRVTGEVLAPQTAVADEREYRWVPGTGRGRIVSWTTVYGRGPDGPSIPQHVLAVVELDEGPWWWTRLVTPTADPQNLTGERVHATFVKSGAEIEDEYVPVFVLD